MYIHYIYMWYSISTDSPEIQNLIRFHNNYTWNRQQDGAFYVQLNDGLSTHQLDIWPCLLFVIRLGHHHGRWNIFSFLSGP